MPGHEKQRKEIMFVDANMVNPPSRTSRRNGCPNSNLNLLPRMRNIHYSLIPPFASRSQRVLKCEMFTCSEYFLLKTTMANTIRASVVQACTVAYSLPETLEKLERLTQLAKDKDESQLVVFPEALCVIFIWIDRAYLRQPI